MKQGGGAGAKMLERKDIGNEGARNRRIYFNLKSENLKKGQNLCLKPKN